MSFLRSVQTYKTKVKDVAWILYCAINEAGNSVPYNEVGTLVIDEMGSASVYATEFVSEALSARPEKISKKNRQRGSRPIPHSRRVLPDSGRDMGHTAS